MRHTSYNIQHTSYSLHHTPYGAACIIHHSSCIMHHLRARCGVDTPAPLHHDVVFPDAIASRVCDAALVLDWRRDHDGVLMGGSL